MTALVVLAKEPIRGRVKTRLCPPCTPEEAACLARAALDDTMRSMAATPARRRVLVLEGRAGPWVPPGIEVIPQRGVGLGERLAAAFEDVGGPAVVIGMDTPQVTPAMLSMAMAALGVADAVLGPAEDGGFWSLGLTRPDRRAFVGIPMSVEATGRAQARRLRLLGLSPVYLPMLRDVDTIEDAAAVARGAPGTSFARMAGQVLGAPSGAVP